MAKAYILKPCVVADHGITEIGDHVEMTASDKNYLIANGQATEDKAEADAAKQEAATAASENAEADSVRAKKKGKAEA